MTSVLFQTFALIKDKMMTEGKKPELDERLYQSLDWVSDRLRHLFKNIQRERERERERVHIQL